jgi:subtilisin family serine protease
LNTLAATPGVIDIQPDRLNRANLAHSVPLIGGATATALGITGQGQAVAILDTGVDKNHPFLSGKVISEACYSTNDTQSGSRSVCPGGIEASTSSGSGVNCASNIAGCEHGTHVAGIAAGKNNNFHGVAPEAKVIAVQVFSRFPSDYCSPGEDYCALSWTSDQILGLERIYALRGSYQIAAVNMSLGGGYWERQDHCDIDNEAEKLAIDNLRSAGIATVIASGNDGYWWGMGAPGCISSAISVGSSTSNAQGLSDNLVSDFSNSVNFLDVLAPGETINSSVPGSGYQAWNGTSMAAPHVAGTFALLKQRYPGQNVASLEALLKNTGTLITDSRNGVTTPRINLAYALATPTKATQLDISQIYLAGFLRAPELGGFNYWKGLNKTPETLATDIFNLPVVKQIYPDSMSNSAFVTAIYNNVFGRSPDSGGLNYWLGQLQGMTRGELVLTMIRAGMGVPDATEGKAFLVNRLLVTAYALNQQLGHQIELQPGDLQFAQSIVNDETTSVQLGYEVIDWMMHLAQ